MGATQQLPTREWAEGTGSHRASWQSKPGPMQNLPEACLLPTLPDRVDPQPCLQAHLRQGTPTSLYTNCPISDGGPQPPGTPTAGILRAGSGMGA